MPVFRRIQFGVVAAMLLMSLAIPTASAQTWGEFYLHEDTRYWWFRDNDRMFEVSLPANPSYAIQRDLFGERLLELALSDGGVYFQVAEFRGGQAELERARQAITSRWQHVLSDMRVTENRTIRTSMGLDAHFTVQQGRTAANRTAMVRTVLFTNGNNAAYLVWTGEASAYTGALQQAWIQAVNSFTWLR